MPAKLRLASVKDLDALVDLEGRCFDSSLYHQTPRRQFRYLIQKGNAEIWLSQKNGTICGSIILFFRKNSRFGRLYSINVLPEYRGGDIGKILFQKAEERSKKKAGSGMLLEIREDNLSHLERYKRIGYKIVGRVGDYYPDNAACIKLKKIF